jgi:opacity protein-like surface antigen
MATTAAALVLTAAPLFAQESTAQKGWENAPGYVTAMGGFATATGNTTGDLLVEGGVRVAPHVMVFGDVGQLHDLTADLQPTLTNATTTLSTNQGLSVIGGGTLPAWYGLGGVRVEIPTGGRLLPYALGGIGAARLTPNATFTFESGTMPDGSTPTVGQDVTGAIATSGAFTQPASSTAFMFTLGAGVQTLVAPHWVVDVGYRYSRLAADTTLSASPLNTNGLTFGVGYRF